MHRLYENDDIAVFWDSEKCFHARRCAKGCPQVFNPGKKPWIDLEKAETPKIWQAISSCPSGALSCVYKHDVQVRLEQDEKRSVALYQGNEIGMCQYLETAEGWRIVHTEVNPAFGGKGIAKRLVYAVVEAAERLKKEVIPQCSYAAKVLAL